MSEYEMAAMIDQALPILMIAWWTFLSIFLLFPLGVWVIASEKHNPRFARLMYQIGSGLWVFVIIVLSLALLATLSELLGAVGIVVGIVATIVVAVGVVLVVAHVRNPDGSMLSSLISKLEASRESQSDRSGDDDVDKRT